VGRAWQLGHLRREGDSGRRRARSRRIRRLDRQLAPGAAPSPADRASAAPAASRPASRATSAPTASATAAAASATPDGATASAAPTSARASSAPSRAAATTPAAASSSSTTAASLCGPACDRNAARSCEHPHPAGRLLRRARAARALSQGREGHRAEPACRFRAAASLPDQTSRRTAVNRRLALIALLAGAVAVLARPVPWRPRARRHHRLLLPRHHLHLHLHHLHRRARRWPVRV
jgi:hypothetical protein